MQRSNWGNSIEFVDRSNTKLKLTTFLLVSQIPGIKEPFIDTRETGVGTVTRVLTLTTLLTTMN